MTNSPKISNGVKNTHKLLKNFCLSLVVVVVSIVVAFGITLVIAVWIEPATAPPGENVDAPLNVGLVGQHKTGQLGVATDGYDPSYGLTVGNAANLLGIKTGNFGIKPISATELGVYDSGGNLILIFD